VTKEDTGGKAFELLADLHDTLMLTAEHSPTACVASFVDSAIQFKRASDFLHASQRIEEQPQ
jgi:hypothetical protein